MSGLGLFEGDAVDLPAFIAVVVAHLANVPPRAVNTTLTDCSVPLTPPCHEVIEKQQAAELDPRDELPQGYTRNWLGLFLKMNALAKLPSSHLVEAGRQGKTPATSLRNAAI